MQAASAVCQGPMAEKNSSVDVLMFNFILRICLVWFLGLFLHQLIGPIGPISERIPKISQNSQLN
jgi:hypothetical protein